MLMEFFRNWLCFFRNINKFFFIDPWSLITDVILKKNRIQTAYTFNETIISFGDYFGSVLKKWTKIKCFSMKWAFVYRHCTELIVGLHGICICMDFDDSRTHTNNYEKRRLLEQGRGRLLKWTILLIHLSACKWKTRWHFRNVRLFCR